MIVRFMEWLFGLTDNWAEIEARRLHNALLGSDRKDFHKWSK